MVKVKQRDIVLLTFPFSDHKTEKVRPAVVISNNRHLAASEDMIVVPMTSNLKVRYHTILLTNRSLESGRLIKDSKIKVDRILSVNTSLVRMVIGKVKSSVHHEITDILRSLIRE